MLKVYVDNKIRLQQSANKFKNDVQEHFLSSIDEKGFASAEMIALAVVGVLIAFGIYALISGQLGSGGLVDKWFKSIFDGSKETKPPASAT